MSVRHVIVDGSNLATEGRSMPSLPQLDQAVREFIAENPTDQVTVVVDASFGHRIDPSEVSAFEAAEAAGEVVSPPAGAIGRGDAFLLRIAEKTGATVLSNDSFQEFHGEHVWLFDKGRLVGGKPVPGVGWIFMDRTPVRGAKSREVTKEAKRKKRAEVDGSGAGAKAAPEPKPRNRSKAVDRAIARATEEVVEPNAGSKARRRRSSAPPADPVNEPLAFITFIAAHPLGSDVVGTVLEYSSHGAFVEADGARCYIPLSAMSTPPPRRAREVVTKGDPMSFVVQAFDPPRRGIELALPGFARVAGGPTHETVEAEISADLEPDDVVPAPAETSAGAGPGRRSRVRKVPAGREAARAETTLAPDQPVDGEESAPAPVARAQAGRRGSRKAAADGAAAPVDGAAVGPTAPPKPAADKAPATRRKATSSPAGAATKAPAKKAAATSKSAAKPATGTPKVAPAKAVASKPAMAKTAAAQTATRKAPAQKASPAKKASAVKAPAKKTAAAKRVTPVKASAKKAAAAPAPAPAKRAPARSAVKKASAAPAKKTSGAKKASRAAKTT